MHQDMESRAKEYTFFELLVGSMDSEVRTMAAMVLTFCVNRLFVLEEEDMIDRIMTVALSFIPDELSKRWLKIHQFLSVKSSNS